MMGRNAPEITDEIDIGDLTARLAGRPVVLVGMMGAGKTTVGRRLATRMGVQFVDSDVEIETAAGMSIPDIFAAHGEDEFRAGEARVIARLLREHRGVIATGGGAFINPETQATIKELAISVWIKAEFEILFARVSKRPSRPLLQTANPRATLQDLIDKRYPIYALADITIASRDVPHDVVVSEILAGLSHYLDEQGAR